MLRRTTFRLASLAFASLLLVAATAAAGGGGPSPGVQTGWDGVASEAVRYVALPAGTSTAVAAVRRSDGRVLRYLSIRGSFGVPVVAFDGTTEGLSRNGRTLVLAGAAGPKRTSFAVLNANPLRARRLFSLPGTWAFDALSPDGTTLYAIEYLDGGQNPRYRVRAVSLGTGRPLGGAIVDKREPDEEMNGSPQARVTSGSGDWAYTLYGKPNGEAFVHALDTRRRRAFCVDLPWRDTLNSIGGVRLRLDGASLVLVQQGIGRLAVVDTRSFAVRSFRPPVAAGS